MCVCVCVCSFVSPDARPARGELHPAAVSPPQDEGGQVPATGTREGTQPTAEDRCTHRSWGRPLLTARTAIATRTHCIHTTTTTTTSTTTVTTTTLRSPNPLQDHNVGGPIFSAAISLGQFSVVFTCMVGLGSAVLSFATAANLPRYFKAIRFSFTSLLVLGF